MHLITHKKCRICGSGMDLILSLGDQNLQGLFPKTEKDAINRKIPLELMKCQECHTVQLKHSVPPELLYYSYGYKSGITQSMRDHLKEVVDDLLKIKKYNENSSKSERIQVLDIASNDFTLLNYYPSNFKKVAIDPSNVAREAWDKIENKENFEFYNECFPNKKIINKYDDYHQRGFDIITICACFYDLDNPVEFLKNIKKILRYDGLVLIEVAYLVDILNKLTFNTICHEHVCFFTSSSLSNICKLAGLKIIDISTNSCNSGTLRATITHENNNYYSSYDLIDAKNRILEIQKNEFEMKLDMLEPYRHFEREVNKWIKKFRNFMESIIKTKKGEKRVHLYGCSTKGNVMIQAAKLDHRHIEAGAERNPEKWGCFTLGTNIPIISEEKSREMHPDYYLCLPFHFKTEIIKRENKYLENGGKLIFPDKDICVVSKDGEEIIR